MTFYPVIMCGGSGTRLWPLSRPARPKQFIPLVGPYSPFRETLIRLAGLKDVATPIVVAGRRHAGWLAREALDAGITIEVLLEPEARDSGPAVAVAAARIAQFDPAGVAVIVASDHHIPDGEAFRGAVLLAGRAASEGWIVTMGIDPVAAATCYGYIQAGAVLEGLEPVRLNQAFVEKPDAATAATYVNAGYLWNSGNFIARADTLLAELDLHEPLIAQAAREAVSTAEPSAEGLRLGSAFHAAPKISFDYAVMERTRRAAVLPATFAWSDLGAWDAVWEASSKDPSGNVVAGEVLLQDSSDCLVRVTGDMQVALVGVRGLAVVADGQSLLVCDLQASQGVKAAAEAASRAGRGETSPRRDLSAWSTQYDQWFRAAALPVWWALGADHQLGGFFESLGQNGAGLAVAKRARVQARQAFTYANAAKLGLAGPWALASEHGWGFFDRHYRRADGLYRTLVSADGAVLNDTAYLYDQAFALMALAALHHIDPRGGERRNAALSLLQTVQSHFRHSRRGYCEAGAQRFQSNPIMHLLEAALAWIDADGGAVWTELATQLVALALDHLIDPKLGLLREFFDADWAPADGAPGRIAEPGHQFEWAWLLDRWAHMSGSSAAAHAARALFKTGLAGWDPARSVAVDEMSDDLAKQRLTARLWPQTEMLKAAVLLGRDRKDDEIDYAQWAGEAAAGLWAYLETPVSGLWRDCMAADGRFEIEPAPASSLYHLFGAVQALGRLRDR